MTETGASESGISQFSLVEDHPIPFDQEGIDQLWNRVDDPAMDEPPSVDEAHEEYTRTIAEHGPWHVFRSVYPFGGGGRVVVWNREFGEGVAVVGECGNWHALVNLFAAIVDAEGDCRDASYSDSLTQSGCFNQRCEKCGGSWVVG